jgi:hypothetical protein
VKFKLFGPLWPLLFVAVANAQPTVFNYQGQLSENGAPANGPYDLRFTLHDTPTQPNQIGIAVTNSPVSVTNGLFTVALDFGGTVFDGSARWLQIGVRSFGNPGAYAVLAPRQPLTSVPYAIRALAASDLAGTLPATNLTGTLPDAQLSTNVALLNSNVIFRASVTATQFNGSGAGLFNVPATNLSGTLPDALLSTNVALLTRNANFQGNVSGSNFFGNGVGLTNVPGRIFEVIPTATNIQALANFGYLATNDVATVVVTLPANMRVGETVRVAGSGAGGWTVAQNAGQTILVGNLSDNIGFGWAPRENTRNWKGIASSADGRKLVAVVGVGHIFTSTNYGTTWTERAANLGNLNWSCVASSGDGDKLVAGTFGGAIFTSTDSGTNWTPRFVNLNWNSVASSLDGVNLVATSAAGHIYTSTNSGVNWTLRLGPANWSSVASSGNGVKLVATVQGGMIFTSTNSGINWTARDSNRAWVSVASSTDGNWLVAAVNNGDLYASADSGTTWTAAGPVSPVAWTSVASSADGARLAAVINLGGIYVSTDSGATWLPRGGFPSLGWTTVASSADGSTLAAAGTSTQIYVSSQATTTPGTAGSLSGTRLSAVELEYIGNGEFMPVSYVGTIRAR